MSEGTVTKRTVSKNGNPVLTIDGTPYVVSPQSKLDVSNVVVGDKLSFNAHSFGDGKIWSLDNYKLISAATKYPPMATSPPPIPGPEASNGSTGSYAVQDSERPCISNWGAELIKAGLVKDPADLGIWVTAIKQMLR